MLVWNFEAYLVADDWRVADVEDAGHVRHVLHGVRVVRRVEACALLVRDFVDGAYLVLVAGHRPARLPGVAFVNVLDVVVLRRIAFREPGRILRRVGVVGIGIRRTGAEADGLAVLGLSEKPLRVRERIGYFARLAGVERGGYPRRTRRKVLDLHAFAPSPLAGKVVRPWAGG